MTYLFKIIHVKSGGVMDGRGSMVKATFDYAIIQDFVDEIEIKCASPDDAVYEIENAFSYVVNRCFLSEYRLRKSLKTIKNVSKHIVCRTSVEMPRRVFFQWIDVMINLSAEKKSVDKMQKALSWYLHKEMKKILL